MRCAKTDAQSPTTPSATASDRVIGELIIYTHGRRACSTCKLSTLASCRNALSAHLVDPVDRRNLKITGKHRTVSAPHVEVQNDVVVIVTQAYGPQGHNLVGISDVTFDGHPAVTLKIRAGGREGLVHLSPIHGDSRKQGLIDIEPGTKCELFCPVSGQSLDVVGEAGGGEIAGDETGVDGLTCEHAAFEREHHAAAEDRVEEGERVTDEQQPRRGAVA